MADRVRVRNTTNYDIGLVTMNGFGYNIKPGMFIMMNREDVEYCMALAPRLFVAPARLVVEDVELSQVVGIEDPKVATFTDADLEKVLKGNANKLKAFLEENQEQEHIIERIARMAKKADLPASKIKVLQDFLPQRDFID
jgi:hypothetical protein